MCVICGGTHALFASKLFWKNIFLRLRTISAVYIAVFFSVRAMWRPETNWGSFSLSVFGLVTAHVSSFFIWPRLSPEQFSQYISAWLVIIAVICGTVFHDRKRISNLLFLSNFNHAVPPTCDRLLLPFLSALEQLWLKICAYLSNSSGTWLSPHRWQIFISVFLCTILESYVCLMFSHCRSYLSLVNKRRFAIFFISTRTLLELACHLDTRLEKFLLVLGMLLQAFKHSTSTIFLSLNANQCILLYRGNLAFLSIFDVVSVEETFCQPCFVCHRLLSCKQMVMNTMWFTHTAQTKLSGN